MLISNDLRFIFASLLFLAQLITFHVARHTFATLQVASGTDIYTVQHLLSHANVATTQIYADILDSSKREAMAKLRLGTSREGQE